MTNPNLRHIFKCKDCGKVFRSVNEYETRFAHKVRYFRTFCEGKIEYCGTNMPLPVTAPGERLIVGIDGEGIGREPHRYVYLAASSDNSLFQRSIENVEGLTTTECLDFLLSFPRRTQAFSFAFNYDLTMMLRDVDHKALFYLFRPELRRRANTPEEQRKGLYHVEWRNYNLNLQGTKFTISKPRRAKLPGETDVGLSKKLIIWDVFKFFQSKFVTALQDWKVGTADLHKRMSQMKDQRENFDRWYRLNRRAVHDYCLEECACMAGLAKKLVSAHKDAGIELTKFYGAGSTASALLDKMNIKEQLREPPPEVMHAILAAFFGGRFENSIIGPVREHTHSWDISSAYPYQICFLPCLVHGRWEHTRNRKDLEKATTAVVRYTLAKKSKEITAWGPFPFRTKDGSICYPKYSGGGWVYKDEYLAGERLFPNTVQFQEAWTYHVDCDCGRIFDLVPELYCERLRIGKEGPGIVIKLGLNSLYGKLAQSIGNAPFNSWFWAGLITSGTRAQILEFLALHENHYNMLMVATDGIYTLEDIKAPKPRDTGTYGAVDKRDGSLKPLGGWEHKDIPQGIFAARAGIYFPLNPTKEDIKNIRARGVGKAALYEHCDFLVNSWERYGLTQKVFIKSISRFCGAKTSIHRTGQSPETFKYHRAQGDGSGWKTNEITGELYYHQMPSYGQWVERPIQIDFDPFPKRDGVYEDRRLLLREGSKKDGERGREGRYRELLGTSMPYDKKRRSKDRSELEAMAQIALEQPDLDSDCDPFIFHET